MINLIFEHRICSYVTISKLATIKLVLLLVYSDHANGYLDYLNDISPISYSCLNNISLNILCSLSWRYLTGISVILMTSHWYLGYLMDISLISRLSQRYLTDISVILMLSHWYLGYLDDISKISQLSRWYLTDISVILGYLTDILRVFLWYFNFIGDIRLIGKNWCSV